MHDNRLLVEARIDRFIAERVVPARYRASAPLPVTAWQVPDEPVPFAEAVAQRFEAVGPGYRWGEPWGTTWFHATGEAPSDWLVDGRVPAQTELEVVADLGFSADGTGFQAEGLFWSPDGVVLKSAQPRNRWLPVRPGPIDVYIEAAGNPDIMATSPVRFGPTPYGDRVTAPAGPLYTLRGVDVRLRDLTVWNLHQDLWALVGLMKELPVDSPRRARLLRAVEHAIEAMDPDDVAGSAAAGRQQLAPVLADPANASAHRVFAVGHAHIDSAWLWPVRETIRKCARTFSNQLALIDDDPDFVFASSSAQQFFWIEQHYPELFERIREQVAAGRFVPMGSMWVESDTNLPGGEALARQLILGKLYFQSRFGIDTQEVWLPDSFGYSGALPQLIRLAGARWFLSQKLSWNESDRMPHHSFAWEGIDGTRVFTHFPPVDTYNSDLSARELLHAERNFAEKGVASASLVPFGWGDGGGGPTREMVAAGRRFADLEGSPTVRFASPATFFAAAEAEYPDAPVWTGELYLEFHRGTYTSQARTKQGNRRNEHLLREAELWAATAAVRTGTGYPTEELAECWRVVLLNQFHDILPGSGIGWVARDAERAYSEVSARLEGIIAEAASALVGEGDQALLLNAAPHPRDGVPALGAGPAAPPSGPDLLLSRDASGIAIDNGLIRLHLTAQGTIDSLVDLAAGRELIPSGTVGNRLQLHRDTPRHWDAWDIEEGYQRIFTDLVDIEELAVVRAPDAVTVRIARTFGASRITQELVVRRGQPSVEITNDIDWRETQKLLKLGFPCDLLADRSASETQFGHVWRPTHENTSWDAAKFEICAHRWVRVAEGEYGVAVSNSATYGHDIHRVLGPTGRPHTEIRLSLLHGALFPDPAADHGRHLLQVVLHPGAGLAEAIEDGYRTNLPPRFVTGGHGVEPLVRVDGGGVVVEAVKLAEDGGGDVVVRLYESLGQRSRATLTVGFGHAGITAVDLLERPLETAGVTITPGRVDLELRPFQIVTLRIAR